MSEYVVPSSVQTFFAMYPNALPVYVVQASGNAYMNSFEGLAVLKAKQLQSTLYKISADLTYQIVP